MYMTRNGRKTGAISERNGTDVHIPEPAPAWAVSQHTDNSKNTKATSKRCYALHSYVETIFSSDKFCA